MSGPSMQRLASYEAFRHVIGQPSRHPVNRAHYDEAPLGARIADRATGFMGSWRFIVIQSIVVLFWISGNVILLFHFDPYPFILLNLAFSTQAAYAAPLILLAGNRSASRDRMTLEHAATYADLEEKQNEEILARLATIAERLDRIESGGSRPAGQVSSQSGR